MGWVREPEKSEEQRRNPADKFFDSVAGRNGPEGVGTVHNEFVIYNRQLCYPLYTIAYERSEERERHEYQLVPVSDPFALARSRIPSFAWTSDHPPR